MKKALSVLVISTIMLSVFFCTPVFADSGITVNNTKTFSLVVGSVGLEIRAVQFKAPGEEFTLKTGDDTIYQYINHYNILMQVKLTNYSDYPQTVRSLAPRLNFNDTYNSIYRSITNVENYTDEMYIVVSNSSGYLDIAPSFYFADGSLVNIAPHSSITAIANLEFVATLSAINSGLNGFLQDPLNSVSIYNDTFVVSQTSVYPQGSNGQVIKTMEDILHALQSSSSTDVSNDSDTLATQSNSVHQQEAAYYAQNSTAIQATGLSNYQFDSSAVSGLTGVRGDFIDVWNALGGWNSIYIFSLTLGLALTILRHSPSAISSALNRKKYSNQGGKTP